MKGYFFVFLGLTALNACDDSKNPTEADALATTSTSEDKPQSRPEATEKSAEKSQSQVAAEKPQGLKCPEGRWLYDYGDNALEAMLNQIPSAKLTRKEGSFICTFPAGKSGTTSCSTDAGKSVVNEISATQAGMPFVLLMQITGGTTSQFQLNDDGTMTMSNTDLSGFKIDAKATIAGNTIPFPAKDLAMAFAPENETVKVAYKCEGNSLKLKPQVEGATVWQELKRVP